MKIGILTGVAKSAIHKATIFGESIQLVGHQVEYFAKALFATNSKISCGSTNEEIFQLALKSDCDFFMGCNDNLGTYVSMLNRRLGWNVIPENAADKTNLKNLTSKLQEIRSWEDMNEVPENIEIFVKPLSGSGSIGGDEWCYKRFNNIKAFKEYLEYKVDGGMERFNYAQNHLGALGKSVFQEYVHSDGFLYHHYLNDGTATQWLESYCYAPSPDKPCFNKVVFEDAYDFTKNVSIGTMCSFQAFPDLPPKIFDFNVRCSAYWTSIYPHVCPDFFNTFFNNFLNSKAEKYDFKFTEFTMWPDNLENVNKSGVKLIIGDYPAGGLDLPYILELK